MGSVVPILWNRILVSSSIGYVMALLAGVAVTLVATPAAIALARRLNAQDLPSLRKMHASPVPYCGGFAILAGWAVAASFAGSSNVTLALLLGCVPLCAIGFIDDLVDLGTKPRFAVQIGAAIVAWTLGVRFGLGPLPLDLVLTTLWIVGITNAFNFMDNMDGLSSSIGATTGISIGLIALMSGQPSIAMLALGLGGALGGFLPFNARPAKIFMGDAGSLPIGFGFSVLALSLNPALSPALDLMVPVILLAPFIVDTSVMTLGRILRREPVIGGRMDHVSHRLLLVMRSVPMVVMAMVGTALAFHSAVVATVAFENPSSTVLMIAAALVVIVATAGIVRLPVVAKTEPEITTIPRLARSEPLVRHRDKQRVRVPAGFENVSRIWARPARVAPENALTRQISETSSPQEQVG